MESFFRNIGSDGIPTWLWDPGILWNAKLFQMTKMSSGILHKIWDPGIPWSNRVFLIELEFGRMWNFQWDLGG